jgi:hypothetical protein
MDRALADSWFLERGDLLAFVKLRDRFARPGGAVSSATDARGKRLEAAIARACPEWAAILRAAARPLGAGGIDPDVLDRVLVDVVAERRGQLLVLRARDGFHAAELADRWHERLVNAARRVTGEAVHVEVLGPAAAGAAA